MLTGITKPNGETYGIVIAEARHLDEVLRIMRENFYHEETMFKSLCSEVRLSAEDRKQIDDYFDGTVIAAFGASPCIVALHVNTSRVVGVNLTTLSENPRTGSSKDGLSTIFSSDIRFPQLVKKYLDYLSRMNADANLFEAFPDARNTWEFYAIAVDKDHRRLGLASDLISAGVREARNAGVSLVFGVFTSIYSRTSAERIGMRALVEFDLLKYIENDDISVFKNVGANNIVTVMVLEIE